MPADSSKRNPPQLPRLRTCDQEIINRRPTKGSSDNEGAPKIAKLACAGDEFFKKKKREHDKLSGKSILLRSPTAKIESPVLRKAALTEGNPKA
uniref:Uncharacterized protein n=1 Tax=Oryza barthii TaxID=65489 RepID=A0A0D3FNC3_9ORYZ